MSQFNDHAIRRATFHYAIQAFAQAAGGIFMLAFLLKSGVSAPVALLYQAGVVAGRLLIRPAVLPLAIRFGVRPLLITGALLTANPKPKPVPGPNPGMAPRWSLLISCTVLRLSNRFPSYCPLFNSIWQKRR